MSDTIIWVVAMAVWMLSTAVFIGGYTDRARNLAMFVSFTSASVFAGAVFGWTVASCMLGWLAGMLILLLLVLVVHRLQKLPPAQSHPHSPH